MSGTISALIPAAGFSSRMGVFKPLLPFGSSLLIEKTISTFKSAGISDIKVVVGYKRELLFPVLRRLSVQAVINHQFEDGMYSSIKAGVRSLDESTEAFFILPGDCAFLEPATVICLANAYKENPASAIYPVHNGRRGHPALISSMLRPLIINSNPEGGLKALLEENAADFVEIPVQDPGIHYDMDNPGDYLNFGDSKVVRFPADKECLEILQNAGVNEDIILHSKEVCRVAVRISEYLNSMGCLLNLGLVMAASLLHDIARDQHDHAKKGEEIIGGLGYTETAEVIALHMDITPDEAESISEAAIVYLADKMVKGSRIISLENRFSGTSEKFKDNKQAYKNIRDRFNNAILIKKKIEKIIERPVEDILISEKR